MSRDRVIAEGITEKQFLWACRNDVNLFLEFVCGIEQTPFHERFQHHLSDHDDCLLMSHRGIGKTTQMAGRCAFELGNDPSLRIKYVQQIDPEAFKSVRAVKSIIETEAYQSVFPDIEPDPKAWGAESFRVKCYGKRGKTNRPSARDTNFEGKGIFGRAGGRADILVADDICDLRNAIQQPAMRKQVIEAWSTNWLPFLDLTRKIRKPRVWKVGTPYHVSDIMAQWKVEHSSDRSLLEAPAIDFRSPCPELISTEDLRLMRKRMGAIGYARAYELRPVSTEITIFPMENLRSGLYRKIPDWSLKNGEVIATIDWGFGEDEMDPSDPDWSVMLVGIVDNRGDIWLRAMVRVKASFPDFCRQVKAMCEACGVNRVWAEANGTQKGLVQQLRRMLRCSVLPIQRNADKTTRAIEQQAYVEETRLHIPTVDGARPVEEFEPLWDEMSTFPAGDHDDTVDAAVDMMKIAQTKAPSNIKPTTKRNNTAQHAERSAKRHLTRMYGNG